MPYDDLAFLFDLLAPHMVIPLLLAMLTIAAKIARV